MREALVLHHVQRLVSVVLIGAMRRLQAVQSHTPPSAIAPTNAKTAIMYFIAGRFVLD